MCVRVCVYACMCVSVSVCKGVCVYAWLCAGACGYQCVSLWLYVHLSGCLGVS